MPRLLSLAFRGAGEGVPARRGAEDLDWVARTVTWVAADAGWGEMSRKRGARRGEPLRASPWTPGGGWQTWQTLAYLGFPEVCQRERPFYRPLRSVADLVYLNPAPKGEFVFSPCAVRMRGATTALLPRRAGSGSRGLLGLDCRPRKPRLVGRPASFRGLPRSTRSAWIALAGARTRLRQPGRRSCSTRAIERVSPHVRRDRRCGGGRPESDVQGGIPAAGEAW